MLETFRPGESIFWDCFWQATVFLGVGLGATIVLARRPARAHWLLLMAIVAGLTAPILRSLRGSVAGVCFHNE